jgi:ABC-type amino acid transport substrate-binding protein
MRPPAAKVPLSVIASAIVSIVISLAFVGCQSPPASPSTTQLYHVIRSNGTIRAAYVVGAPLFMIDPNTGTKSGIFHDIVTTAANRLGLKVNWTTETGYGQMAQDLQDNKYDLVGSGVWINAERAKSTDFSMPLFYDAVFAYARASDAKRLAGLPTLNHPNITISTMDGELGAVIAAANFPKAKTLALPQNTTFTQLILNVVNHKADVVFLARGAAADYDAVHPGEISPINPRSPLRIFPNALMLGKGQYLLRDTLNYVLAEMANDGTIDVILKKYEKTPNALLRLALPYQIPAVQ